MCNRCNSACVFAWINDNVFMDEKTLQLVAEIARNVAWTKFQRIYSLKGRMPAIKLNRRLKTTAGRCSITERWIDLSVDMMRENLESFKTEIIPHEVAHQVAFDLYKDEGHGMHWKSVMIAYGLDPKRCHSLTTKASRAKAAMKR